MKQKRVEFCCVNHQNLFSSINLSKLNFVRALATLEAKKEGFDKLKIKMAGLPSEISK